MSKEVSVYRFVCSEENLNKMIENHYVLGETSELTKKKKVDFDNELVKYALRYYNDKDWIKATIMMGLKPEDFGITYKNGKVEETEKFVRDVCKFKITIDLSDEDCWVGVTGENILYPGALYNKEVLDRNFSREINKLKKLGLIEEIKVKV